MEETDEERINILLGELTSRMAEMNNQLSQAYTRWSISLQEDSLGTSEWESVKAHIRKYNNEKEIYEEKLIELDQLLNK